MRRLFRLVTLIGIVAVSSTGGWAQDKFFDAKGVKIRYVEQGTGEPIILLHGIGESLQIWFDSGVFQNLAADHRVIAMDARGHGKSGKPHDPKNYGNEMALDIVRLLDHLSIKKAHIVGYSMSGFITSKLLTMHPERFLTATLLAGAGQFRWSEEDTRLAEQEASEREKECVSRTLIFRLAAPDRPKPGEDAIKQRSAACFADQNQDRFAIAALTRSRRDRVILPARAAAVTVPTLGMVGSLDGNLSGFQELKTLRPSLKLLIVDGATHSGDLGVMRRAEFITSFREFIASNRSRSEQ